MEYAPALLAVELVAHVLAQLLKVALRLGVVGVHHQVLEMPEAPAEVLEPLALLEEAGDLRADLCASPSACWSSLSTQQYTPSMSLSMSRHRPSC